MKGVVTSLYPLEKVDLPEEFLDVAVCPERVEEALTRLSLRYAEEGEADTVQAGDTVYCRADADSYPDGRTILLYPAVQMPGAEEAVQDLVGRKTADSFSTTLGEKEVILTIEKIIRPVPVEVNDALIASMGIEGVSTVEEYRAYMAEKMRQDAMTEKHKLAMAYVERWLEENSTFAFEEGELEEAVAENRDAIIADYLEYDLPVPSESEMREAILMQNKQIWLSKALCEQRGMEIDTAQAEEEADQMLEMLTLMGEEIPNREKLLEQSLENEYLNAYFTIVDEYISGKLGV